MPTTVSGVNSNPMINSDTGKIGASSGANPTTNGPKTVTDGTNPSLVDKNLFLKLLVAQLKYQNPMQPNDPSAFLQQSASFTMIEKLEALNQLQQSGQVNSEIQSSSALIGKKVSFTDSAGAAQIGVVKSVALDPVKPPTLKLDNGKEVRLQDITKVESA